MPIRQSIHERDAKCRGEVRDVHIREVNENGHIHDVNCPDYDLSRENRFSILLAPSSYKLRHRDDQRRGDSGSDDDREKEFYLRQSRCRVLSKGHKGMLSMHR